MSDASRFDVSPVARRRILAQFPTQVVARHTLVERTHDRGPGPYRHRSFIHEHLKVFPSSPVLSVRIGTPFAMERELVGAVQASAYLVDSRKWESLKDLGCLRCSTGPGLVEVLRFVDLASLESTTRCC